jgi:hypothetical protein
MAKVTDYGTLKQAVMDWLARADLAPYVDQLVQFAEVEIYNDPELRLRQMEVPFEGFVDCEGKMMLPPRYLELKHAYLDRSPRIFLERAEPEYIYETYGTRYAGNMPSSDSGFAYGEGIPKFIAREGDSFIFGPYPVEPMTVKGIYLRRFNELVNDTDTNWILTNHPDLFLYGTLRQAEPFIKNDSRLMMWDKMYQGARQRIRGSDRRERFSQPVVRAV